MDNLTHSLVGVALADLSMGRRVPNAQRPLLVGAGVIAANLPDIDIAYSMITPSPVGYLLHHRGHTHTIAGLGVLLLGLVAAYWFSRSVRKMRVSSLLRFWLLISVALASHLALDALNNYGVHPFYPFDARWYYGDAVFIFEPSLWLILGVAAAWNGRSRAARLAAAVLLPVLLGTMASTGILPFESVAALAVAGAAFAWISRDLSPAVRAAAALTVCALIVAGLAATSRIARSAVVDVLKPMTGGKVVDVALTPNPSSPLCWGVIAIEMRRTDGEYVLWKGTLSLAPEWRAASACASHSYYGAGEARAIGMGRFVLEETIRQPLPRLRALAQRDCWVHAWLRFGRVPVIDDGWIFDLRYGQRRGQNFTHMPLTPREGCPGNVPGWLMPREDMLK